MLLTIAKRVLAAVPILFGVVVVTFVLTRMLPGDPAVYFAGNATSFEAIEEVRRELGLDRDLFTQFLFYLHGLATGDLGRSWSSGRPVSVEILERLPASLELTFVALFIGCAIAIPMGVLAATRAGKLEDQAVRVFATAGVSVPAFFTGLLLIFLLYYHLGWAPAPTGRLDAFSSPPPRVTGFHLIDSLLAGDLETFRDAATRILLPAASLALVTLAPLARMTRAAMLAVLTSDFIRTARAAGLPRRRILWTYAFRNAMLPVLTTLGMVFSYTLGANVMIEKVFSWPGIGSFALDALMALDYAPLQGFVLTMGVLYVLLNLMIDILYTLIDPRVTVDG